MPIRPPIKTQRTVETFGRLRRRFIEGLTRRTRTGLQPVTTGVAEFLTPDPLADPSLGMLSPLGSVLKPRRLPKIPDFFDDSPWPKNVKGAVPRIPSVREAAMMDPAFKEMFPGTTRNSPSFWHERLQYRMDELETKLGRLSTSPDRIVRDLERASLARELNQARQAKDKLQDALEWNYREDFKNIAGMDPDEVDVGDETLYPQLEKFYKVVDQQFSRLKKKISSR